MEIELFFLALIGFVAGVINIMAGGGSLLTLPMLIFLGLPPAIANGTNRVAILIQNIFSISGFRSKGINTFPYSIYFGLSAMVGAIIGAQIAIFCAPAKGARRRRDVRLAVGTSRNQPSRRFRAQPQGPVETAAKAGGSDGTRTRGLCRDRAAL